LFGEDNTGTRRNGDVARNHDNKVKLKYASQEFNSTWIKKQ